MNNAILVVDDEPNVTALCQRVLAGSGFDVLGVTDPREGLNIIAGEMIRLLLVDVRMPEMNGFEMIDAARHLQPDLAVVVMTGLGTLEMAVEALRRGSDGLILKPFTVAELVQSVQHALETSENKKDVLHLQALRPLFDLSENLFAETNPRRLQDLLLDALCGYLKSIYAGLYEPGQARGRQPTQTASISLRLVAAKGSADAPTRKTRELLERCLSVVQQAYTQKIPLIINLDQEPENHHLSLPTTEFGAILCAPVFLRGGRQANRIFLVARQKNSPPFREWEVEMATILARQGSVALENARLHTELKTYIRQLEASQRALVQAEKMAIAGRLTASIAHEINNPLQSVQNCLHLASRDELPPADRTHYLNLAQSELQRLMNTVQRMLEYYRPARLERKPIRIQEIISKVSSLTSKQLQDSKVTIHTQYNEPLPPILAVGDQIQQVFLNLILNAIEAMPSGGEIFIDVRCFRDESQPNEEILEVMFADTGPGVSLEKRKQLFEPFISSKDGGTGLGLAVSYGIMTAHEGTLDLVEGRQTGACFRLTFKVE